MAGKKAKLVAGFAGGLIGVAAGTLLLMYFVTGVGAYDLPPMARALQSNRAAAVKAGIWKEGRPAYDGAMAEDDFIQMATIPGLPVFPVIERMPADKIPHERTKLASRVQQAHAVAAVKDVAWKHSWVMYPKLAKLKYAGKILAWDARLAARMGRNDEALKSIQAMQNLARVASTTQDFEGIMVALAIDGMAEAAAADCGSQWLNRPEALRRLRSQFERKLWEPDAGAMVRAHEFATRNIYETYKVEAWTSTKQFNDYSVAVAPARRAFPVFQVPGRMTNDALLSRHFVTYTRLIRAADRGWEALYQALEQEQIVADQSKTMTSVFFGGPPSLKDVFVRREARSLALRAGLSVLLKDKNPLPEDPYLRGQPLRMAKKPGGFVIYSAGKDRKDNGGNLKQSIDIGFEFKAKT